MKNVLNGIVKLVEETKKVMSLSLAANISVGTYAWGRYGFYPKDNGLKKGLLGIIASYSEKTDMADEMKNDLNRITRNFSNNDFTDKENSDPKSFWDIVDLTIPVERDGEEMPLGKAALLDYGSSRRSWNGILDLGNEKAVDRLKTYIGY